MKRKTRAEVILDIYDREAMGEVTPREIAIINEGLREEFGDGGVLAPVEIASILTDEDLPVRFDQIFNMSAPDDRYERLCASCIDLATLETAEASLSRLEGVIAELGGERRGEGHAMAVARRARDTARLACGSEDLNERERAEQSEIAEWFTIWMQTPQLFWSWLDLRKRSKDFRQAFAKDD